MKVKRLEESSSGKHERFVMHIGRDEIRVLLSLCEQARLHMPRLTETTQVLGTIRQVERDFRKVLALK